jgi:predicted ATPase
LELFMELATSTMHAGQVLVATQSTALLDLVTLDKVVVVGRHDGASTFTRYSEAELYDWLGEYSLSQLYAKNVLGGRP